MPIVRKLLIAAALNGVLLKPLIPKSQQPIQIEYGSARISRLQTHGADIPLKDTSLEVHGLVGIISVARLSFLVAITDRKQVAQIRGKPIFVITGVAIIPLSSQGQAIKSIEQVQHSRRESLQGATDGEDSSDDEGERPSHEQSRLSHESEHDISTPAREIHEPSYETSPPGQRRASILQEVIEGKTKPGRLADVWGRGKGWLGARSKSIGLSGSLPSQQSTRSTSLNSQTAPTSTEIDAAAKIGADQTTAAVALLPKFLKTTKMLLSSSSFYFSYDMDLTRSPLQPSTRSGEIPLCKIVQPNFWWNRHLSQPILDAGFPDLILPLLQGFIGQRQFSVPTHPAVPISSSKISKKSKPDEGIELDDNASDTEDFRAAPHNKEFLLTLISRRSTRRPGLRYLRRGVDGEGDVANFVESEQILSDSGWDPKQTLYSYTQVRGSIPLFFSQSPYALKPIPIFQHSEETNQEALKRHFRLLQDSYGPVQAVNLVDRKGGEQIIGDAYEKNVKQVNDNGGINGTPIKYEWFDFHHECRGMKFENVSMLLDKLTDTFESQGMTVLSGEKIVKRQNGIIRTNCMDCLDRTNVVQTACAQHMLQAQLQLEGVHLDIQNDISTSWFNTLWADNGDNISRQYSSTAALKGDFTRTRKRDYRGALNDFSLTMTRYFNNIVNDFFSQASIDYLLGNVSDAVFDEFEANMMSADPGVSMRKLRQNAIETSSKRVIADEHEDLITGWTMLTPEKAEALNALGPMTEIILLLTNTAVYIVRFDWNTEKVTSFERIDAHHILELTWGVYVTSTHTSRQTDPTTNLGVLLKYKIDRSGDTERVNTRSLATNTPTVTESPSDTDYRTASVAFKAIQAQASEAQDAHADTPHETVEHICAEISRVVRHLDGRELQVDNKDIVSLEEAQRGTTLLDRVGWSLKKLVWA